MYSSARSGVVAVGGDVEDDAAAVVDVDEDSETYRGRGFNVSGCRPRYAAAVGTSQ